MSARGHKPRTSERQALNQVGTVPAFRWSGVGDYTRFASQDPADIVTFDLQLDDWLAKGFPGMNVGEVYGLRKERKASR